MEILANERKIAALEDNCQDLEGTIGQFRELVMQLQTCVPLYQRNPLLIPKTL
jgi:hypothetical protein